MYLQLHGMYPKPFKFEKRRILEADCDLQNGQIPPIEFASPSSMSLESDTGLLLMPRIDTVWVYI